MKGVLLWSSCLFMTACTSPQKKYKYTKQFTRYLTDIQNIKTTDLKNNMFYVLPVNECNTCLSTKLNLNILAKTKPTNLTVILIGLEEESVFKHQIKNLKHKKLFDNESSIYDYQTSVSKPLLIHFVNSEVINFFNISDTKVPEVYNFLNNE
ncbi:hypothetical protein G1K72_04405 [Tenacibaculum finnmarkense]|uniref:hypothetical protein n=2 Tax=Tenacibaculum finnmarkense TaxID=2781243 RepID=UPI001EFAF51D|nr:hypothetical protein [Tenacibaculum finnmarkense]MBE7661148.1 hypothetical protein [Tenacibaculum finnmarkense genomovar finnmarkense]MCG8251490.1 hypothetical protein [Tenacibaculum finnmarkense genomovar finnmarkense]MCG8820042.1 hypothetical protein [Tenacibaculum finnmarkense]